MLIYTGAAGVMIGRAAQGQPWLCGHIARYLETGVEPEPLTLAAQFALLEQHIRELHAFYGDFMGVRIARKHMGWYLQYQTRNPDYRRQFNGLGTPAEQRRFITTLFHTLSDKELAA